MSRSERSADATRPRRWTLTYYEGHLASSDPRDFENTVIGESVEVMPVAEHEAAVRATVREIAWWLRHIDRLDEIPGAKVGLWEFNPLWDASFAIEREFGGLVDEPAASD